MGTRENLLEGTHSVFQRDEFTLITSEDLGDLERLRHETLNFTSTLNLSINRYISDFHGWQRSNLTVSLSSSDNSSIPRMAMIS